MANEGVGVVHGAAAMETGIPKGTPVVAGTVDAYAEAFSVGVGNPGDPMLMCGSTMFLVQIHRRVLQRSCVVDADRSRRQREVGLEMARRLAREWLGYKFDPNSGSAGRVDAICGYESEPVTP